MSIKGDIIKKFRIDRGLTQVELAERVGVSKQSLYKYENGIITNIPSDIIERIASALDIEPSVIMGWSKKYSPVSLSSEEESLVCAYRNCSEDQKDMICRMLGVKREISSSSTQIGSA